MHSVAGGLLLPMLLPLWGNEYDRWVKYSYDQLYCSDQSCCWPVARCIRLWNDRGVVLDFQVKQHKKQQANNVAETLRGVIKNAPHCEFFKCDRRGTSELNYFQIL